jgi:hypothetical protein
MLRRRRRVVLALADTHCGSRFGLLDPKTVLIREHDDGSLEEWTPVLTATQELLWEKFRAHLEQFREFAGRSEVLAFHDGDLTDGNRYPEHSMPDVTLEDQRVIAAKILGHLKAKTLRLVTGTAVHVPESAEARVAARLGAECYHHGQADVDGVVFEFAHHGPSPGIRDWTEGNVALYHLRSRVYADRRRGLEPARVHAYAHYHQFVRATHNEIWEGRPYTYDLVVVPSYSGLKSHGRKVTRSTPFIRNGMVAFEVVGGKLGEIRVFFDEEDLRTKEVL